VSPRDSRLSAAPEAEIARLDSDAHHLREQADIDRRTAAQFRIETREQLERVNLAIATQGATSARIEDKVCRLESDGLRQTQALESLAKSVSEQRGAVRLAAWAIPAAVALVELGAHLWGAR
jgi:hypothetical protein